MIISWILGFVNFIFRVAAIKIVASGFLGDLHFHQPGFDIYFFFDDLT